MNNTGGIRKNVITRAIQKVDLAVDQQLLSFFGVRFLYGYGLWRK
jgi:hypothetical protein